jgi:hypothetical protein
VFTFATEPFVGVITPAIVMFARVPHDVRSAIFATESDVFFGGTIGAITLAIPARVFVASTRPVFHTSELVSAVSTAVFGNSFHRCLFESLHSLYTDKTISILLFLYGNQSFLDFSFILLNIQL